MKDEKNINYSLLESAIENGPVSDCDLCGQETPVILLKPMSETDERLACMGCGLSKEDFHALLEKMGIPFEKVGDV